MALSNVGARTLGGVARGCNRACLVLLCLVVPQPGWGWGGTGHKATARLTMESLKGRAAATYAPLADRVVERVMDPDDRVDTDPAERVRHFYDLEAVGLPLPDVTQPTPSPDTSLSNRRVLLRKIRARKQGRRSPGTLPTAVQQTYENLVAAHRRHDENAIIILTADLSHYLADAHQPLHATDAYDGLGRFQKGVHSAFETELVKRCRSSRPRKTPRISINGEQAEEVAMAALLESHALASRVLGVDLGCGTNAEPVCRGAVPRRRAGKRLACDALAGLARERMELAAGRTAALLERAVEEARRPR